MQLYVRNHLDFLVRNSGSYNEYTGGGDSLVELGSVNTDIRSYVSLSGC